MKKTDLPVFEFILNDESEKSGVNVLSLVKKPAIELVAMKFADNEIKQQFKITDEERMIFMAPIMRADYLIFRDKPTYFYGYFSKQTVFDIAQKYFRTGKIGNIDVNHSGALIDGAFLFESFIIDSSRGIHPPSCYDGELKDGDWFGSFQVIDRNLWNKMKNGEINGVSIEGLFNMMHIETSSILNIYSQIKNILEEM
jgi:Putative phage serine protease XkdF